MHLYDLRYQFWIMESRNRRMRLRINRLHMSLWPAPICTGAVWSHKPSRKFSNGDGHHIFAIKMTVSSCILGRHRRLLENSPKAFNSPPTGAYAPVKRRSNAQVEIVLFLCRNNQLSGPRHMTWKVGDPRSKDDGNSRMARPGNKVGIAILHRPLQRFPMACANLLANCGTAKQETTKGPTKGLPKINKRRETVGRRLKRSPNEPASTRTRRATCYYTLDKDRCDN